MSKQVVYGVTGTREGVSKDQRASLLVRFCRITDQALARGIEPWLIHGGCRGVDVQTHQIVVSQGWKTWVLPGPGGPHPDCLNADVIEDERPFLERNHLIVERCRALTAVPKGFKQELRSGTWATVRHAVKLNRRTAVVWPDGGVTVDGGQ